MSLSNESLQRTLEINFLNIVITNPQKNNNLIPPPVYQGIIALTFADRTAVFLHAMWHPEAIRPPQEIARYENKQVVVVGKMVPRTPEPPEVRAMIVAG